MKEQTQAPIAKYGPYEIMDNRIDFVIDDDSISENHQAFCYDLDCRILVTKGRIHMMFPHSMKSKRFKVFLYEKPVIEGSEEVEWEKSEWFCEPCLTLGRVLSIIYCNDEVIFEENCDHYFYESMTKANAIRLLEEAIEFIRKS